MKVQVNLKTLKNSFKGMDKTHKSVSSSNITKNIHIIYNNNEKTLCLLTTNLMTTQYNKIVLNETDSEDFSFSINLKKFEKLLKVSTAEFLTIEKNNNFILIYEDDKSQFTWKLKVDESMDMPEIKTGEGQSPSSIIEKMKAVIWIANRSGTSDKTYKRMVNFSNKSVSTFNDTYAAHAEIPELNDNVNCSIDRTAADAILNVFKNSEDITYLNNEDNKLYIGNELRGFIINVCPDKFNMDWISISELALVNIEVSQNDFLDILSKTMIVADQKEEKEMSILLTKDNNIAKIIISSKYNDEEVSQSIEGKDKGIPYDAVTTLNCEELINGIKNTFINCETVIIGTTNNKPIICKSNGLTYMQSNLRTFD